MQESRPAGNYHAVEYTVRVRKWHPGYWWYCLRSLRSLRISLGIRRDGTDSRDKGEA